MKTTRNLLLVFLMVMLGQQFASAQKTLKVWVVRHAEKSIEDPKDRDPELSADGKERADALMKRLKGDKIDSIYSTGYKRTKLTVFPLADHLGLSIKTYDPSKQKELAKQLLATARGKKILIVGHSNTVLEMVEALGGTKPEKALTDDDYDYIFEVTIKGDKVEVKADHYGKEHHTKS